ncbi:MAG: response regulator transcription factor [Actinomycetota bacterium]|nr:response regulator transcription factor [Actinomycetota bacterium]
MAEVVRVALCDDHAVVRRGLQLILEAEPDLVVVGVAGGVAEAVVLAEATKPDVFVMDLGLPDGSGIDAIAELRRVSPATQVLILTVHDDVAYLRSAFAAGAAGYVVKEAADTELVDAVRQVAAGRRYVHPTLGAALLAPTEPDSAIPGAPAALLSGPGGELSEREVEVMRFMAMGLTSAEIAERLYVSVRTIETHRAHIHQKLDVRNRAQLVRRAREAGLLDGQPDA